MASFSELQAQLKNLQFRRQVFLYVIDHTESEFLAEADSEPNKKLLTDEKTVVPASVIDAFVDEMLNEVKDMEAEISKILSTQVGVPNE